MLGFQYVPVFPEWLELIQSWEQNMPNLVFQKMICTLVQRKKVRELPTEIETIFFACIAPESWPR